jgi:hypothetical protein
MSDKYNQDMNISEQWLAEQITQKEAGAEEVNIAQTKEILKITLELLHTLQQEEPEKFDELLSRH